MRRWIAIFIFVAVAAIGWRVLGARGRTVARTPVSPPQAASVEVAPVGTQSLQVTISAAGNVEALEEVNVSAKISGRVIAVFVKEGATVRAGQILARLEGGEQAAQVRAAEGALQAAQARLQMLQRGARPQERAQIESAVAQAGANYEGARANLARMKSLYEAGAIGKAQLDAAQLQAELARQQYDAAKQQLSLIEAGPRVEELEMARAQVRQAQAGLAYAQLQSAATTITSPISGTVTRRYVDPGVLLSAPGQSAVVRVAQIDSVYVVLEVSETDLNRLRVGQVVKLRMDAYSDRDFPGTVREMPQTAEGRSRIFKVKVLAPNPGHLLKPGMFGRGEILVARHDNAIVIPRDAVVDQGTDTAVFVAENGTARLRKIRVGLIAGPVVEVLEGVHPGDRVIVSGQSGLIDGAAITVR